VHVLGALFGFERIELGYFAVMSGLRAFSPLRPLAWARLVTHIFGHTSWDHLNGEFSSSTCESASKQARATLRG
jgi:membrane associated rhomboid family serine protease